MIFYVFISIVLFAVYYLWHLNRALDSQPDDAKRIAQKPWTEQVIQEAYARMRKSPIDVRPFIPAKQGRRYIVVGGSGLVGSWIVQHLLWRGEDPKAIRILDAKEPTRPEALESGVDFQRIDVCDGESVSKGFKAPWANDSVSKLALTVFHSASRIAGSGRMAPFTRKFEKVNVGGTRHVLDAAREAGCTCFIATSSGSVSQRPPEYWILPWQRWPKYYFQYVGNADVREYSNPVSSYASCYSYTKAKAEKMVRDADDRVSGFRTGCIRPGHAIYGHGVDNVSSLSWDYLRRGGTPTWIANMTHNFAHTQNVSIGHLCFERAILETSSTRSKKPNVCGNAYCITDPNPPIRFGDFYNLLVQLAKTPMAFPRLAPVLIFLPSYLIECYSLFQVYVGKKLGLKNLIEGDIEMMQPTVFNLTTLHLVYSAERAEKEIGFKAPIRTLEGFCMAVLDWNTKAEAKLQANGSIKSMVKEDTVIPKVAGMQ